MRTRQVLGRRVALSLQLGESRRERDDSGIGLILCERGLQDLASLGARRAREQVDDHVVCRSERGNQRVRALRREGCDLFGCHSPTMRDDSVPFGVDTATPRASRELRVFTGGQRDMRRAVPLRQRFDDDCARRHIDAERERLGRVHHLDEAARKQVLDALFHEGQHSGVVGGDAAHEATFPRLGAKDGGILGRKERDDVIHVALDLGGLRAGRQRDARGEDLAHRILASCPREDERDGGQQPRAIKRNQCRGARLTTHANLTVPRA